MAVKREDIATVGRAMYAEIREEMEANHWGKMVVIDVNSGDYEIGDDDLDHHHAPVRAPPGRHDLGRTGRLLGAVPHHRTYQPRIALARL